MRGFDRSSRYANHEFSVMTKENVLLILLGYFPRLFYAHPWRVGYFKTIMYEHRCEARWNSSPRCPLDFSLRKFASFKMLGD